VQRINRSGANADGTPFVVNSTCTRHRGTAAAAATSAARGTLYTAALQQQQQHGLRFKNKSHE